MSFFLKASWKSKRESTCYFDFRKVFFLLLFLLLLNASCFRSEFWPFRNIKCVYNYIKDLSLRFEIFFFYFSSLLRKTKTSLLFIFVPETLRIRFLLFFERKKKSKNNRMGGWFWCISTFVVYLIPNPVHTHTHTHARTPHIYIYIYIYICIIRSS